MGEMFVSKVVMGKEQVMEKQNRLRGKIWTMLKRYMGKRLERNAVATGLFQLLILYKLEGFWSFSRAALSDTMSNPLFSLGSLMMDAMDSQLLSGTRIVSLLLVFKINFKCLHNKNTHFWNVHLKFPFKAPALPPPREAGPGYGSGGLRKGWENTSCPLLPCWLLSVGGLGTELGRPRSSYLMAVGKLWSLHWLAVALQG